MTTETKTREEKKLVIDIESINRSQIARDAGCTLSHVSRIFNGIRRPSLTMARKIAESLNITMEQLDDILDFVTVERIANLQAEMGPDVDLRRKN